jgi:hypothetical protein
MKNVGFLGYWRAFATSYSNAQTAWWTHERRTPLEFRLQENCTTTPWNRQNWV